MTQIHVEIKQFTHRLTDLKIRWSGSNKKKSIERPNWILFYAYYESMTKICLRLIIFFLFCCIFAVCSHFTDLRFDKSIFSECLSWTLYDTQRLAYSCYDSRLELLPKETTTNARLQGCLWTFVLTIYKMFILFQRINDIVRIYAVSRFQRTHPTGSKEFRYYVNIALIHLPDKCINISFHSNLSAVFCTKHDILFYSFQQSRDFVEPTTHSNHVRFHALGVDCCCLGSMRTTAITIISKWTISLEKSNE